MTEIVDDTQVDQFLEAVYERYGHDFRHYARTHVKRRLAAHMRQTGYSTIPEMQRVLLHDRDRLEAWVRDFSIPVTEMFRDPEFFHAVRECVLPLLRTWAHIRIWHAGCSTGEEVYSMAMLLKEAGLYERSLIYATDMNQRSLDTAAAGIYPLEAVQGHARNYQRSGAKGSFADHCLARYGSAIMDRSLKKNIVWGQHNLATDSDFAEVQMVVCRNVLIYFDRHLQHRVHDLFHRSLVNGGLLCLGAKESITYSGYSDRYETLDRRQRIYRKKYGAAG
jgi:chemotaxis protein methyltransferase CheR